MALPRWRLTRLGLLGLSAVLAGCATYQPLPLPASSNLASSLGALDRTVPAIKPGAPSRQITVQAPLTINDIGLLAALNDPGLRDERGRIELARAGLLQSTLLPNPSVSLGYQALLGGPGTSAAYSASISQSLNAIITYQARTQAARTHVQAVAANLLWREWQVMQKARLLALQLYWLNRAITLNEQHLQQIDKGIARVRKAISVGSLDLTTLAPLQVAQASIEQNLDQQRLKRLQHWQALDSLLGLQPNVRFAIAEPQLAPVPNHLGKLLAGLPQRRPDLVALSLGYRASETAVRSAILGQFPALVLGGSWGSDTSQVRSAGPDVTFDLPIFDRNQGQIAKTRATRQTLHAQYRARLDSAVATVRGLQARLARLRTDLAQASQAASAARSLADTAGRAYAQGDLALRILIDYRTTSLQRELQVLTLQRQIGESRITLAVELAQGLPDTRITPDHQTQ